MGKYLEIRNSKYYLFLHSELCLLEYVLCTQSQFKCWNCYHDLCFDPSVYLDMWLFHKWVNFVRKSCHRGCAYDIKQRYYWFIRHPYGTTCDRGRRVALTYLCLCLLRSFNTNMLHDDILADEAPYRSKNWFRFVHSKFWNDLYYQCGNVAGWHILVLAIRWNI